MFLSTLLSTKLAVAVAATGLVTVGGGAAAAAYTGVLPSALQTAAHDTIGAPAPHTSSGDASGSTDATSTDQSAPTTDTPPAATPSPVGPDANGPAAFGLCTAFLHQGLAATSVAYQSLLTAAGGTSTTSAADGVKLITTYCSTVTHPGQATSHPTGKPTTGPSVTHPTGKPTTGPSVTHPTGKPTTVPVGPPSTH
jgi:hypothetical protein